MYKDTTQVTVHPMLERAAALRVLDKLDLGDPRFLELAVEATARIFDCRCVAIGLLAPDQASLTFTTIYHRETRIEPFDTNLAATPCEAIYTCSPFSSYSSIPDDLADRFGRLSFAPGDDFRSYRGEAIFDAAGRPFAHLAAFDNDAFTETPEGESLFRLIGHRISTVLNHRRTRDALINSEDRFRTVIDQIVDSIILHDLEGQVLEVNRAACESLGYTRDELLQKDISEIEKSVPVEMLLDYWQNAAVDDVFSQEGVHARADGTLYPVDVRGRLVQLGGAPTVVISARNISELKKSARELRQAQHEAETASRAKSAFVANMSHELRTPLNAIIGFSDILKHESFGPIGSSRYMEYADDIHRSGTHLLGLVSNILDLSKIEAGQETLQEKRFALSPVVKDCLSLLSEKAAEKKLTFRIALEDGEYFLYGDEIKIKQVLLNLATNAVKFSFPDGVVHISAQIGSDGGLEIAVSDSGPGIEPDRIELAFESFQRLDHAMENAVEGTGLGLPISRKLCELHGGTLHLESELGTGTSAIVRLPESRLVEDRRQANSA